MSEWKELSELVERKIGYGIVQPGNRGGNVPVIKVNNIINGLVSPKELETTAEEIASKYERTKLTGGELIISLVGTVGATAIVPKSFAGCNLVRATGMIDIKDQITAKYVKYYLETKNAKEFLYGRLNTTVQPTLNIKTLENLPIPIIDREKMVGIVSILSSLDDKIAVNRKICENLEAQAQALFKHWFIDFAPFKDGKFVESELGKIPEGWKVGRLSELVEIKYGKDHKKLREGTIPAYGSAGLMRYVDNYLYQGESVLIPRKGTLNNVMLVNEAFWTVDTMFYTIPKCKNLLKYIFLKLSRIDFTKLNVGTSIPSNSTDQLNKMTIIIPPNSILKEFDKLVESIIETKRQRFEESSRLSTLRDTLLPKLMKGEIEV